MAPSKTPPAYASPPRKAPDYPTPRPHALDQGYLEERFAALEARLAVVEEVLLRAERRLTGGNKPSTL